MNKEQYNKIIRLVAYELKEDITEQLVQNVVCYCKTKNLKAIEKQTKTEDEFCNMLSDMYINYIKGNDDYQTKTLDVKQHISNADANIFKTDEHTIEVFIDSHFRDISNYTNGQTINRFDYIISSNLGSTRIPGHLQVNGKPTNIASFEICDLAIPYSADLQALNPNNIITLAFTNLSANSIINSVANHHFTFNYSVASYNPNIVILNPSSQPKKFIFNPPLRTLDNLNIQFLDPYDAIPFAADLLNSSAVDYINTDGRISFASAHGLSTNDVIRIRSFTTTNDSAYTSILSQILNSRGIKITKINSTTISTGIDFSQLATVAIVGMLPVIEVVSRGFRFAMKIKYISNEDI